MRPTRSRLPFTELRICVLVLITPEYTRTKVSEPTKGSVMILNARPAAGASSLDGRLRTSSDSGFTPFTSGTSVGDGRKRSEEHTSELQSLMRISYAVFCLKKKNNQKEHTH